MLRELQARLYYRMRRLRPDERPIILCYHRVIELPTDLFNLAVHPRRFAAQMEALTKRRSVVPLDALLARPGHAGGKPLAAITFDDGYFDAVEYAKPILARYGASGTVYVATGIFDGSSEFWWDELERIVLGCPQEGLPLLARAAGVPADRGRTADIGREALTFAIHRRLKPLSNAAREAELRSLAETAGTGRGVRPEYRGSTRAELRAAADEVLQIGAHTRSHPSLPTCSPGDLADELAGPRRELEELLGSPVKHFCYPFGDVDRRVANATRDAGYETAVTMQPGGVGSATDRFRLPRLYVGDWDADEFVRRLGLGPA